MPTRLLAVAIGVLALVALPAAQSDLDDLMGRVLERREEDWKKLQQYILDEEETFQLVGPGALPIYGSKREYAWFPRDGIFIRSPLRADGVAIDEDTRAREETKWVERERRREKRRSEREAQDADLNKNAPPASSADEVTRSIEPQFVSAAYFLRFKFDPGQYALVGRDRFAGRDVLKIEYYPTKLFTEGRTRPNRRIREKDEQVEGKMNKTSLVTFWVDATENQILGYEFENVDLDFMKGRSLVRIDGIHASMRMGQPFAGVWLPELIEMRFELVLRPGPSTAATRSTTTIIASRLSRRECDEDANLNSQLPRAQLPIELGVAELGVGGLVAPKPLCARRGHRLRALGGLCTGDGDDRRDPCTRQPHDGGL